MVISSEKNSKPPSYDLNISNPSESNSEDFVSGSAIGLSRRFSSKSSRSSSRGSIFEELPGVQTSWTGSLHDSQHSTRQQFGSKRTHSASNLFSRGRSISMKDDPRSVFVRMNYFFPLDFRYSVNEGMKKLYNESLNICETVLPDH